MSEKSRSRERSKSTGLNTSLLESESIHLPLIYESPPRNKHLQHAAPRPSTAPAPHSSYDITSWQALSPDYMQPSNLKRNISGLNDDHEKSILFPLPSQSSPERSFEFDETVQHLEGRNHGAIEITNEGTADANIFRAKVHIEEIKESVENDSFAPDDATTYERPDQSHARDTGQSEVVQNSSKGFPKDSVQTSVSLTADEAASLLHLAAAMIQACIRGFLQRRKYQKLIRNHKAAVKIQAIWRGYFARNCDLRIVNIRNEIKVRTLNAKISFLETKINRARTERKIDKAVIVDAIKILVQEITLQRETLNKIEAARQKEKDAKNELHEICLGLQTEILHLRSVIGSGEIPGSKHRRTGLGNEEDGNFSTHDGKEEVTTTALEDSSKKRDTEHFPGDIISSLQVGSSSLEGTLKGSDDKVDRGLESIEVQAKLEENEEGKADLPERYVLAECSSDDNETSDSSLAKEQDKKNIDLAATEVKTLSLSTHARLVNSDAKLGQFTALPEAASFGPFDGISGKESEDRDRECNDKNGADARCGKEPGKGRKVPSLNETYVLDDRSKNLSADVEVFVDDMIEKNSLNANRVVSSIDNGSDGEGGNDFAKNDEKNEVKVESGDDENHGLKVESTSQRLEVKSHEEERLEVIKTKDSNKDLGEDFFKKKYEQHCDAVKFKDRDDTKVEKERFSVKKFDIEDYLIEGKTTGPHSDVLGNRYVRKDPESIGHGTDSVVDNQRIRNVGAQKILDSDARDTLEKRPLDASDKALKAGEDTKMLTGTSISYDGSRRHTVPECDQFDTKKLNHTIEAGKDDGKSSIKYVQKDPGVDKNNENYGNGLLLEGGLNLLSKSSKTTKRRRTLFPKVFPVDNDIDTAKEKMNLSADSKSDHRPTFFSPVMGTSKKCTVEHDIIEGDGDNAIARSKDDRLIGDKDVMFAGLILGRKDLERRELYCYNRDSDHDSGIKSVYKEVSAYHGNIVSGIDAEGTIAKESAEVRVNRGSIEASAAGNRGVPSSRIEEVATQSANNQGKKLDTGSVDTRILRSVHSTGEDAGTLVKDTAKGTQNTAKDPGQPRNESARSMKKTEADAKDHAESKTKHDRNTLKDSGSQEKNASKHVQNITKDTQTLAKMQNIKTNITAQTGKPGQRIFPEEHAAERLDTFNEDPGKVPETVDHLSKETSMDTEMHRQSNTESDCLLNTEKTSKDGQSDTTAGEAFDTIIAVDDSILRNTRTSTPVKRQEDAAPSHASNEQKNAGASDLKAAVRTNMSPRLNDIPECLYNMPTLVPMLRKDDERAPGLPMFIDQSIDSADDSFTA